MELATLPQSTLQAYGAASNEVLEGELRRTVWAGLPHMIARSTLRRACSDFALLCCLL